MKLNILLIFLSCITVMISLIISIIVLITIVIIHHLSVILHHVSFTTCHSSLNINHSPFMYIHIRMKFHIHHHYPHDDTLTQLTPSFFSPSLLHSPPNIPRTCGRFHSQTSLIEFGQHTHLNFIHRISPCRLTTSPRQIPLF